MAAYCAIANEFAIACRMSNNSSCMLYDQLLNSGYAGAVASVAAIVLILFSKTYKDFSYRLYLYIATSSLALSVFWCTANFLSGIGHGMIAFFSSLIALLSCWLSFHILLIVTCRSRVACSKKRHFEIAGLLLVLVLSLPIPILIRSMYLDSSSNSTIYNDTHSVCNDYEQVKVNKNETALISIFLFIPAVSIFGVIFISIAIVALTTRSFCSTQLKGGARKFYRKALKAALPFLLLQICGFLFSSLLAIILFDEHVSHIRPVAVVILLYPCSFLLLPILLLCQSQVTHNLKCRRWRGRRRGRGGEREDEDRLETAPFSRWSTAVSSGTQFISPNSSFTEQDPLIIRQVVQ